jgi:hypothetical protein
MYKIKHRTLNTDVRDGLRAVERFVRSVPRADIDEIGFNRMARPVGAEPCGWIGVYDWDTRSVERVYFRGAECRALEIFERTFHFA